MRPFRSLAPVLAVAIAGCAGVPEDTGTLKSLESRRVTVDRGGRVEAPDDKAISSYRDYLKSAPNDPYRPEALRRLGDLEIERSESRQAPETQVKGATDYRAAIAMYQDLLKAHPNYAGNDRVLYQLARAYEASGDLRQSLRTLDQLIARYPATPYRAEAEFRRGELLFTARDYGAAQQAYEAVMSGGEGSLYYERALYMHGWSHFKQLQYDSALQSFFRVLDRKLIGRVRPESAEVPQMSRADAEMVDDTFRAMSLSLSALDGAESIPRYIHNTRQQYEFLVYRELGDLYRKQERAKDAADSYQAFARRHPTHPQSAHMQVRVIEVYQQAGFASATVEAKKTFVTQYGLDSAYRQANRDTYDRVQPLVRTHLEDLARHYHAAAQKTKQTADYQEATRWYRGFLKAFPADPKAPGMNFLLAEMLYEDKRYAEAAVEYEMTAYHYAAHAQAAEAGYRALLAHAEDEKRAAPGDKPAIQKRGIESGLRFATAHPGDARTAAVLTSAAEKLYARHDPEQARAVAQRVLNLEPQAQPALRRTAWTVMAHVDFERGAFDRAEHEYKQALALLADKDAARGPLTERLAASVYKQGEQARAAGHLAEAVTHFERVALVAPASPMRATAEYDAAATLITAKQWNGAARILEDFRVRYPGHALQDEVTSKLAAVYLENRQWDKAATELEHMAAAGKEPKLAREALWQAAELYEKGGKRAQAAAAYERYVKQNPEPFETAIEARHRLAEISRQDGQAARRTAWLKELVKTEQSGAEARTDRTRYLAAQASLVLAEPYYEDYRRVALVEPLKKNLKLKKAKMEEALKAYTVAVDYGVADVATASTFKIADLYHDFSRALLESQRPKGLKADELEQYNVLLEEQAYPFEEKAIEVHEVNARRTAKGLYDQWVQRSFTALGKLRPVRYAKTEREEGVFNVLR
jgi:TolA-binding protein